MLEHYWTEFQTQGDPLTLYRKKAWDRFNEIGFPESKAEAFQYINLKKLQFPKPAEKGTAAIPGVPENTVVFVDGFFEPSFSSAPFPVVCQPLGNAMRTYGLFLQSRLSRVLKEEADPFATLNIAFQGGGGFLYIPPNWEGSLNIVQCFTKNEMASPRLQIYLGRNARVALSQRSQGVGGFSNSALDAVLDEGACLSFTDRQEMSLSFQTIRASLKRDAHFKTVSLSKALRTSIRVQLLEENAETELYGLARLQDGNESHVHVLVEHIAPHTRSKQHFKNVLNGKSKSSFEGKIWVAKEAQKTQAYQLNNNLLLSAEAVANAKPNLEIFADDVKASHGATVGCLDAEQLFYLRSRGLPEEIAKEWLIEGFCREITDA
jgi:Fe-S cluster assembly protein SufD